MKKSLTILLFFISTSIFCQQNSSSDIFPLEIGNRWIYNFYQSYQSVMPHYQNASDGIFEYRIIGKDVSADSIIWHFYQKWVIHQSGYGTGLWTTYKDSSSFDIIEVNSNHQLIVSKFIEKSVFLFARSDSDKFKFNRFSITNDQGKAFYTFDFLHSSLPEKGTVDIATYQCSKDSGITYMECSKNLYTSWWKNSFRLKEFIRQYKEPYLSFVKNEYIIKTPFGTPKDTVIEIRNDGLKPLFISSIILPSSKFTLFENPFYIMPESRGILKVRFASDVGLTINTSLVINSNSINSVNSIPITGIAYGEPVINLGWVDDHLYTLNNNVVKYIFPITNIGNIDLRIDSITIDNPFFSKRNKNFLLKPNGTVIDTILFLPLSTNYFKGTVSIFNNSRENPKTFVIWGYSGRKGNVNINLHKISFPKTEPGKGRDTSIVFTNNGPESIYISSEQKINGWVSFVDEYDFDLLKPGESRIHKISFWPASSGYLSDEFYYFFKNQHYVLVFQDTIYVDGTGFKDSNSNNLVTDYSLSQNYPNPFNPTTTIKYSIPVETLHITSLQHVTLKVYDMLGREVATLVNEEKASGNYKLKFDGTNLTSGVYFYRLQSGSFTQTKKFVLMK